jgi:hypothetical protein
VVREQINNYKMDKQEQGNAPLTSFFSKWVGRTFEDLQLQEYTIANYLTELLTRFARTESLYRIKNLQGKPIHTVVEMMIEADRHAHPSEPGFDPFNEREIMKHVGDYTLFMTGIFREYVERLGVMDFYRREGERSYYEVYEFDKMLLRPKYEIFMNLFRAFEMYSGTLHYMKKVYFRPELHSGSYRTMMEQLSHW